MEVAKISEAAAATLAQTEYKSGYYFNPVQDADGNHIISLHEAQYLSADEYEVIEFNISQD